MTGPDDRARDVDRLRAVLDADSDTDGDVELGELKAHVVLHHMFQFTGLADLDGTLLEANQTALDAGGIQRSDVIGRPVWEAHWFTVSDEVQQRIRRAIAHAVEHGELVRYDEDVYAGTQGTATIPIDFSARPVRGSDGEVAFLVLEGRDIAEKQHAQQLKDQLFANVSHELRTPLTVILGRADALLQGGLDDDVQEAVRRIADNARVLLGKVNDLLQVAALEAGGISTTPRRVDVRELARVVTSDFRPVAEARGVDLRLDAPAPAPAKLDPDHVGTILANLVSNACKVVDSGGTVVVEVDAPDDEVVLEVRDDGPGIPAADQERVFDAFHQLESTTSRRHGGTGLGLAIVRQLVELLDGTVDVGDAVEGGARFRVTLPAGAADDGPTAPRNGGDGHTSDRIAAVMAERRLAADTSAPVTTGGGDDADGDHLLLVEDNPDLTRFLAEQLADTYRLSVAADGQQALDLLASDGFEPDLVITDLMMPQMGGDELIDRLQADDALASIPVLVLTAREDQQLRDRLLAGGASDYLVKPFSVPELRARVENLLGPTRMHRELAQANAKLRRYGRQLSHDLKAPVTSLVGLTETIRDHAADLDPETMQDMLDRMVANGYRLASFVDDLLDEVRGQSGRRAVPVGEILDEVTDLLADDLASHGARVEVVGPLPEVDASRAAVRSVLINLLSNALNYRAPQRAPHIRVGARRTDSRWEITVADNGRGVSPQDRERIFEPSDRGSDAHKQAQQGTGMGLFASRELVERYGGRIWVEDAEPHGAQFRFTLPAVEAAD